MLSTKLCMILEKNFFNDTAGEMFLRFFDVAKLKIVFFFHVPCTAVLATDRKRIESEELDYD